MKSSPWIAELSKRPFYTSKKTEADIAIVGGGIAGVSQAYFLLTRTQKTVMLLEQNRIGSGATGHNAGHVVVGFEKSHMDIIKEFGEEKTFNTYGMLNNSWKLLAEMRIKSKKLTPFFMTKSYTGYTEFEKILNDLDVVSKMKKRGIQLETFFLFSRKEDILKVPKKHQILCKVIPLEKFSSIIPNKNSTYIAFVEKKRGLMNSAHFVETITAYLLKKYKDRFFVTENESVKKISFKQDKVVITSMKNIRKTQYLILCTNGYKGFELEDSLFKKINTAYQNKVQGLTGFMVGYEYSQLSERTHAFGIHDLDLMLPKSNLKKDLLDFSYLYLSERPYQNDILMVAGGVESLKTEENLPKNFDKKPEIAYQFLNKIIKDNLSYSFLPNKPAYAWQGLMGYTKNLVRIVGKEPKNERLFYNIGCNGNGILPSIASGERIAKMLLGEKIKKTIFDTE